MNDVAETIDDDRRRFLARAAMTIAAFAASAEAQGASRELTALARAREWLNSPSLTPETLSGKVVLVDFLDPHLQYPIVIDNDYAIWRAFNNQYWPALYLVDGRGRVRQRQFGEGESDTSERAIQRLLKEVGASGVSDGVVSVDGSGFEAAADWSNVRSPETQAEPRPDITTRLPFQPQCTRFLGPD